MDGGAVNDSLGPEDLTMNDAANQSALPGEADDLGRRRSVTAPPTHSEDGVDLTLIRWMLSLSPLERLRTAQRYANSAQSGMCQEP